MPFGEFDRAPRMVLPEKTVEEFCASMRGHLLCFRNYWKNGAKDNDFGFPESDTMPNWLDYFVYYMTHKSNMYSRVPENSIEGKDAQ